VAGGTAVIFQPVLPPLLLAAVAAAIVVARVVALRRLSAAGRTRTSLLRWCGLTLAALLLLVAAARPVIGSDEQATVRVAGDGDPNVFLVVDRSADMRVEDLAGGRVRMAGARDDIAALIDRYPDARFAVIAFASRPSLDWPLSADTWSLRPVTSAMTPYSSAPDAVLQTNVGAAGNVLRYQLIGARQQYPRAQNLVFYLGAGAAETQVPQRQFELPEGAVDGGAVLGYGSAEGGPIPGTDVARSAIDEPALRGVADQIGVPYVSRDGATPLAGVLGDQGTAIAPPPPVAAPAGRTELYWAPAIGAAILILIELYLVLRELRRTRLANADVVV
jgi:Ca-activated chloride channel homolog